MIRKHRESWRAGRFVQFANELLRIKEIRPVEEGELVAYIQLGPNDYDEPIFSDLFKGMDGEVFVVEDYYNSNGRAIRQEVMILEPYDGSP